jgi:uncharacterized membrane protein
VSKTIAEIVGIFVIVCGAGTTVAAAAQVSTALALLAAGVFALLAGTITVYVANALAARPGRPTT